MKELFPEYYSELDVSEIWEQAIFVPDTCVLLNVYDYAPASSKHLLDILSKLAAEGRIWIPYQFAYEYHKNLDAMHGKIEKLYSKAMSDIKSASGVSTEMKKVLELVVKSGFRTDRSDAEALKELINNDTKQVLENIESKLKAFQESHISRLDNDDVRNEIARLFVDRVGDPSSKSELAQYYSIAQSRIGWRIPLIPPSKNIKDKPECFGDYVAWEQIKVWAGRADEKIPIVLISDDNDWYVDNDKPHPYLLREMFVEANVRFHAFATKEFRIGAENHLGIRASQTAKQEDDIREEVVETEESSSPQLLEIDITDEPFAHDERMAKEFSSRRIEDADFRGRPFRCTDLKGARFFQCDFSHADLSGADLRETSFILCNLTRSNLIGADLTNMRHHACNFDDCILPDGEESDVWTDLAQYTDAGNPTYRTRQGRALSIRNDICDD